MNVTSYHLTRERAEDAVGRAGEMFLETAEDKVVKRGHFAAVVLDPTVRFRPMDSEEAEWADFITNAVLYIRRFGHIDEWQHDYDYIALSKAFLSWRWGLPSRRIQHEFAYLCEGHDTVYGGSIVDEGGLIVACSGVDSEHDEGFATVIMGLCKSFAQHSAEHYRKVNPNDNFYGQHPRKAPEGYNLRTYCGR